MKTLLIIAFASIFSSYCFSQNVSTIVKILDLSVYPAIELDTVSGTPLDTGKISFNMDFKVSNVSDAASVRILVGTNQNSGDILNQTSNIVFQSGQYYISQNGAITPVNGYSANIRLNLTKQQEAAFNYIELFIVDNQGNETNRLYFNR